MRPDILIHGSPCQDFSIAGKQYGGNVEDGTRSSLLFETVRIITSLGEWKSKVVIWENVPNVLSKNLVSAFEHYLDEMEMLGYTNSYEVLDARDFGVPQARKRLFTVSMLNGIEFDFSKMRRTPMRDISEYLETDVDDRYLVTQPSMIEKLPGREYSGTHGSRKLSEITEFSWTITTKQMRSPNSGVIRVEGDTFRYLTELECWRLMGFDDEDYYNAEKEHPRRQNYMNGTLYHQAGNSIVVDVLESMFEEVLKVLESGIIEGVNYV